MYCGIFGLRWCHQESNRGHKDFQSFALPTELWHLAFAGANIQCFFDPANEKRKKIVFLQISKKKGDTTSVKIAS